MSHSLTMLTCWSPPTPCRWHFPSGPHWVWGMVETWETQGAGGLGCRGFARGLSFSSPALTMWAKNHSVLSLSLSPFPTDGGWPQRE